MNTLLGFQITVGVLSVHLEGYGFHTGLITVKVIQNFQRKAFFSDAWKPRKDPKAPGSLLVVTGAMRRSIKSEVVGHGVRFSSSLPYTTIHNEGGKGTLTVRTHYRTSKKGKRYKVRAHKRRFNIPQRQFIGDGKETQQLIKNVIDDNLQQFSMSLAQFIRKRK